MVKFGRTENLLGVVTQYQILGFCRLDVNSGEILLKQSWGYLDGKSNVSLRLAALFQGWK